MDFEEKLKRIEENAKLKNKLNRIGIYTIKGPTGPKGDSLNIKDSYDTIEELYKEHPEGEANDCYVVNGSLYIWDTKNNEWKNIGNVGAKGEQGPKGDTGEQGPKGEQGEQGPKGDIGPTERLFKSSNRIIINSS